jgi:hypothetical protein
MQIIKSTDPITVDHPVFLIFGQPGICKTSLTYSAKRPLLLDFDQGAHRAINRKDTLKIETWADVAELMEHRTALDPYDTVIVDTVGRCLDLMIIAMGQDSPKYLQSAGAPSQTGWGVLKGRFKGWMTDLRARGKDVILVAHDKEDKSGDTVIVRPDIQGGSYGEVMKIADFVGYICMNGRNRVLDFSPTDRWVGKNPGQWTAFKVPTPDKALDFMAIRIDEGRAALGQISAASADTANVVQDWQAAIKEFSTAADFNRAANELERAPEIIKAQIRPAFKAAAEKCGVTFDKTRKAYVDPAPPAAPVQVELPPQRPVESAVGF